MKKKKSKLEKKLFRLKVKGFLLIVLPVSVVTLGKAVIEEYAKIKIRQVATAHKAAESADSSKTEQETA